MTHIINLQVENIGGAENIQLSPKGKSVTIGGPNRAGKTSAIRGLIAALGGKELLPSDPVRHGAEGGRVVVELPEFIVRLDVSPDRSTRLRVETTDGARFTSPQKMLDKLFGNLSFDPGVFRSMEDRKRKAILMQLTGLDFADLDRLEKDGETDRAYKKKRAADLESVGKSLPADPEAPAERLDISAILKEIGEVGKYNQEITTANFRKNQLLNSIKTKKEEIAELEERIADLKHWIFDSETQIENGKEMSDAMPIDMSALQNKLSQAETLNQKFDRQEKRKQVITEWKAMRDEVENAENYIKSVRKQRADRLAAAKFPIEGLAFAEGDVSYNGIPFAQLSESEQWEVSTAISFALNPRGIVFMGNCGGLDKASRERVRQRASAAGVQLFLEVVDDAQDVQVLIEEGKVTANRLET
jgi:hypothetical protein